MNMESKQYSEEKKLFLPYKLSEIQNSKERQEIRKNKNRVFLLKSLREVSLIFLIISIGASPAITDEEWKSFASTSTVGLTGVSAFLAAVLSIHNASTQAHISQDLEKVKKVLEKGIAAHGDLYAAAINYYRVLAPLDTGDFSLIDVENAEAEMRKVEGLTLYVSEKYASKWLILWQHARYIKETVHKDISNPEDRKKFWQQENAKKFGKYLKELENLARQQFA